MGNKVNPEKREATASRIIEALKECNGLLTLAARRAGVTYRTVKRYADEYPTVAEAYKESKETMLDVAEGKLYQAIGKGESWAICFYLKTQGKHRGYVERQEVTGKDGNPLQMIFKDVDPETKKMLSELKGE
jgi:hypothetical protein